MSAEIPTTEPAEVRVGLTWAWKRQDLTDYPASAWTLTYWFKQQAAAGAKFSVVATADGDNYAVSVSAATSGAYTADDYTWVAVVSSGSEAYEVDRGTIKLLPKYNTDSALDDRTHAKKMLEAVEAALEAFSLGVKQYSIGQRTMTRRDIPELTELRDKYRAEVFAELQAENARNGKAGNQLLYRL